MKIKRLVLYHLHMALVSPFETSFGKIATRDCIILEANTDELTGWGECVADRDPGYSYETAGTAWHILKEFIVPMIIGRDIKTPTEFHSLVEGVRGHLMAKAGLEMVLWDLQGKQESRSLRDMIGGKRDRVEVGVSVGIQPTTEALVKAVAGYLEQGYQRVKIKIKPGRDATDTLAVRRSYPSLRLQVDANSAYTLDTADRLLRLDDLNLLLIEQPLGEDDIWDHSKLQHKLKTPICLDESILTLRHARQAMEMDACRVINIKTGRVGGPSQAIAIHNLCQQNHIPVWCGGMLETGVGRATNLALASLPNFLLPGDISATDRYYAEDITDQRFELNKDSTINVPTFPGLGITINRAALQKVTIDRLVLEQD